MDFSSPDMSSFDVLNSSQNLKVINPGNKIDTIKLDGENFLLCKLQVLTVLWGHGLKQYIEEDLEIPPKFIKSDESSFSFYVKTLNPVYEH